MENTSEARDLSACIAHLFAHVKRIPLQPDFALKVSADFSVGIDGAAAIKKPAKPYGRLCLGTNNLRPHPNEVSQYALWWKIPPSIEGAEGSVITIAAECSLSNTT